MIQIASFRIRILGFPFLSPIKTPTPQNHEEGQPLCRQLWEHAVSDTSGTEEGMEPDDLLWSRNARPQNDAMMRGRRPTVLLAHRAPTIKRWSLDALSEEQSAYFLWGS